MAIKKCGECGGQVSDKAEKCPACGAPVKKPMGLIKKVGIGFAGFFVFMIVVGAMAGGAKDASSSATNSPRGLTQAEEPEAAERTAPSYVDADIKDVLAVYKGNELKGDQLFKDKKIRITGKVDDVKKDILNNPFITLGTGKQFEIPQIQCSLADSEKGKAAEVQKGQQLTIVGEVSGLMMNVQLANCIIE